MQSVYGGVSSIFKRCLHSYVAFVSLVRAVRWNASISSTERTPPQPPMAVQFSAAAADANRAVL